MSYDHKIIYVKMEMAEKKNEYSFSFLTRFRPNGVFQRITIFYKVTIFVLYTFLSNKQIWYFSRVVFNTHVFGRYYRDVKYFSRVPV